MTKSEKLANIRARYEAQRQQKASTVQPAVASPSPQNSTSKEGMLSTLGRILQFNKKPKPEQPVAPVVSSPAPVEQPVVAAKQPVVTDYSKTLSEHRQQRNDERNKRLYEEAIRKNIAIEGTVDALALRDSIQNNYDDVARIVKSEPEPAVTKRQNTERAAASMRRKELMKTVTYVQPNVDNNIPN